MFDSYMEELVAAWIGARRRDAQEAAVISLIQKTDARFTDDEDRRQRAGKQLQMDFYRVAIAEKLGEQDAFSSRTTAQLLTEADKILAKRHHRYSMNATPNDMRTPDEQRYQDTARVRWCNLLKKAGVPAFDNRGGDTSYLRRR
jgi:hypothetical protein